MQNCDDGNPCTVDGCAEASGNCTNSPIAPFCIACSLLPCTWDDPCHPKTCVAGVCVPINITWYDKKIYFVLLVFLILITF